MNMLRSIFPKKEETIESLVKDCNKLYFDFKWSYFKAHTESYFLFKQGLADDFEIMKHHIAISSDEPTTLALLKHFKEQLKFIVENPFIASEKDFKTFIKKNYPYEEKIQQVKDNIANNIPLATRPKF